MSAPSVHIAKDRLHHLLMADRMKCTPDMAEKLSRDMYHTIAKYIEIRPENFQQIGRASCRERVCLYV